MRAWSLPEIRSREQSEVLARRWRVPEPHNINSRWTVRWIGAGKNFQVIKCSASATADHVVHQIAPKQPAGVSETLRVFPSRRIQQDARRLERLCAQHNCL